MRVPDVGVVSRGQMCPKKNKRSPKQCRNDGNALTKIFSVASPSQYQHSIDVKHNKPLAVRARAFSQSLYPFCSRLTKQCQVPQEAHITFAVLQTSANRTTKVRHSGEAHTAPGSCAIVC